MTRIQFFASRLKYSRWIVVTLVEDQGVETLVRALLVHFVAFGGVPLVAVFDRPKTIALSWRNNGEVTEWNPTFAAVTLELGIGVEVCWPASPEQKGSVENLVGWVKGSFFKQRRFLDEQDLKRQLAEWMVEVNETRPSRATRVIPAIRLAEERPRLRPLKVKPEELALRIPVVVGPTGMVSHEGRLYSMPAESISVGGTLYLYQDRVRIVVGRHEAVHQRLHEPGARSLLPEHRALAVAAVSGKRARRYLKREHILALGQDAFAYVTELVHRRPRCGSVMSSRSTSCCRPTATRRSARPCGRDSANSCSLPSTSATTSLVAALRRRPPYERHHYRSRRVAEAAAHSQHPQGLPQPHPEGRA